MINDKPDGTEGKQLRLTYHCGDLSAVEEIMSTFTKRTRNMGIPSILFETAGTGKLAVGIPQGEMTV